jgi:hypothetical protein
MLDSGIRVRIRPQPHCLPASDSPTLRRMGHCANYDIARDGRILINTVLDDAASPITLIQSWNPEAKK